MFCEEETYAQNKIDSVTINSNEMESTILYSAKDSIYSDLKNKQIHLFNEAKIDNGEITVEAGYILIDLNKNEVTQHIFLMLIPIGFNNLYSLKAQKKLLLRVFDTILILKKDILRKLK